MSDLLREVRIGDDEEPAPRKFLLKPSSDRNAKERLNGTKEQIDIELAGAIRDVLKQQKAAVESALTASQKAIAAFQDGKLDGRTRAFLILACQDHIEAGAQLLSLGSDIIREAISELSKA